MSHVGWFSDNQNSLVIRCSRDSCGGGAGAFRSARHVYLPRARKRWCLDVWLCSAGQQLEPHPWNSNASDAHPKTYTIIDSTDVDVDDKQLVACCLYVLEPLEIKSLTGHNSYKENSTYFQWIKSYDFSILMVFLEFFYGLLRQVLIEGQRGNVILYVLIRYQIKENMKYAESIFIKLWKYKKCMTIYGWSREVFLASRF